MTAIPAHLTNVQKFNGESNIHTVDEKSLPIVFISDIPHSLPLTHVLYSPYLPDR